MECETKLFYSCANESKRNQRGNDRIGQEVFFSENKEVYVMNGMNGNHRGRRG